MSGRENPRPVVAVRLSLYLATVAAALLISCGQPEPTLKPTPSPAPATEVPFRTNPVSTATPNPVLVTNPTPSPTSTPDVVKERQPTSRPAAAVQIPTPEGGPTEQWSSAVDLFHQALAFQNQGETAQAIETYQRSIAAYPTAEAHTSLAWNYSGMGDSSLAMLEARKAIALDPDYGNPYNDIGFMLIEMGEFDAAIPWLNKAIAAKRYEPRHFPHLNLGVIWVRQEMWGAAFAAFEEALRLSPGQRLPTVDVVEVPVPLGVETPEPLEETVDDLVKALAGYFDAWNRYDPVALIESADLYTGVSVQMVDALLLHMARAKSEGSQIRFVDAEIVYFSEPLAILGTELEVEGRSVSAPYLLVIRDGEWKVAGQAVIFLEPRR